MQQLRDSKGRFARLPNEDGIRLARYSKELREAKEKATNYRLAMYSLLACIVIFIIILVAIIIPEAVQSAYLQGVVVGNQTSYNAGLRAGVIIGANDMAQFAEQCIANKGDFQGSICITPQHMVFPPVQANVIAGS